MLKDQTYVRYINVTNVNNFTSFLYPCFVVILIFVSFYFLEFESSIYKKNHVGAAAILKISNGLFVSKLRYGLQLLGSVRWMQTDPTNQDMDALQKCLNKLLRALNGSKISDQISTKSLLSKFKLLSVNQMNAHIKLCEIWKSTHLKNYPIETTIIERQENGINTRARSAGLLIESKVTNKSQKTFVNNAIHIWNMAPSAIKDCKSFFSAKKAIKVFVSTLPI